MNIYIHLRQISPPTNQTQPGNQRHNIYIYINIYLYEEFRNEKNKCVYNTSPSQGFLMQKKNNEIRNNNKINK